MPAGLIAPVYEIVYEVGPPHRPTGTPFDPSAPPGCGPTHTNSPEQRGGT